MPMELTCTLDEVSGHLNVLVELMVVALGRMLQWLRWVCDMVANVSPSLVISLNVAELMCLVHSIAAAVIVLHIQTEIESGQHILVYEKFTRRQLFDIYRLGTVGVAMVLITV